MPANRFSSSVLAVSLVVASSALAACGGDTGGNTGGGGGTTMTTSSTTSTTTEGTGGSGGSGMCATGKTIKGKVTYAGTAGPNDTLRIAAVKDGMPGIPASFNQYTAPAFPLDYELTGVPVDMTAGFTNYGVIAYLDYGSDDFMGPGMDDPQSVSMTLIKVTACEGGTLDIDLPMMP